MHDRVTLIALSALAYLMAVALHEHGGHAAACVLLGSQPTELGAFYVNCDNSRLSAASVRMVELAGPIISLLTGLLSWQALRRVPDTAPRGFYFLWLLGTVALMDATGYPLFSGISGLGDLGTTQDGALRGAQPEWLWRALETLVGAGAYYGVVLAAIRRIGPRLQGAMGERVRALRGLTLISYLTGAVLYLLIGLLNPYGILILAESALASSLGGTSGLLWMSGPFRRRAPPPGPRPALAVTRGWSWILVAAAATLAYGIVLGPSIRP